MKELSVEEKAKRYDEAIGRANDVLKGYNPKEGSKATINYIFPELKESEDEKVRKEILEVAKTVVLRDGTLYGKKYNCREWIAWLEKLKVFTEHGAGLYYFGNSSFTYIGSPIWDNDSWLEKQGEQEHTLDIEIPFGAKDSELQEATYLIPEGFHAEIKDDEVLIKKGKQEPAWSDKDDSMFQSCIGAVATNDYYKGEEKEQIYDWLKSLKQRYTWKPSDEQMKALDSAIDEFDGYREFDSLVSLKEDLEKLKEE